MYNNLLDEKMKILLTILHGLFLLGCANTKYMVSKTDNENAKKIYLTFDDGPNGTATEKVLETLEKNNIKATFFVIGKNVERHPILAKAIVKKGHIIENHSYGIGNLLGLQTTKSVKKNLQKTNKIIFETTGYKPKYFRPPNGLMTNSIQKACAEIGLIPVGVNIFVNDSFSHNAKNIAKKVLLKIKGGEYIIVLHDGFGTYNSKSRKVVADALEIIIKELNKKGYRWGTIEDKFNNV